MGEQSLFSRDRIVIGGIIVVLVMFAVLAATRLTGGGGSDDSADGASGGAGSDRAPTMSAMLPVTETEFQDALSVAVAHGESLATFDPDEPRSAYPERLRDHAERAYGSSLTAKGTTADLIARKLAKRGVKVTGVVEALRAPTVAESAITVELALRAEAPKRKPVELGDFQVSLLKGDDGWRVAGVTDSKSLDSMQGEGRI